MSTNQTKHVQLPRQFNQVDLEALQAQAVDKVLNGEYVTTNSGGFWRYPAAAERQFFNNPDAFLTYVGEQAVKGIAIYPHESPQLSPAHYSITYYRPADELDALIEQAKAQAKVEYEASLEAFNNLQIQTLQNQLVAVELAKEEKKEQERLAAIKAKALKTATDHIQSQLQGAN